jgi:hypothetical protein
MPSRPDCDHHLTAAAATIGQRSAGHPSRAIARGLTATPRSTWDRAGGLAHGPRCGVGKPSYHQDRAHRQRCQPPRRMTPTARGRSPSANTMGSVANPDHRRRGQQPASAAAASSSPTSGSLVLAGSLLTIRPKRHAAATSPASRAGSKAATRTATRLAAPIAWLQRSGPSWPDSA